MIDIAVTSDWLVIVAGFLLSLAFSYVPGLNTWYAAKAKEFQKLLMAGIILLVLVVVFVMQCAGFANTGLECTPQGVINAVIVYGLALAANQGVYGVSPQTNAVKNIRLEADKKRLDI